MQQHCCAKKFLLNTAKRLSGSLNVREMHFRRQHVFCVCSLCVCVLHVGGAQNALCNNTYVYTRVYSYSFNFNVVTPQT